MQNAQKRRRFAGAVFESMAKDKGRAFAASMRSKEQDRARGRMEKRGKSALPARQRKQ
ncbi:MAG: hypothetical protein ACLUFF_02970 [Acutalibacteraceae bacterium]